MQPQGSGLFQHGTADDDVAVARVALGGTRIDGRCSKDERHEQRDETRGRPRRAAA
jgi:hypothetical protein